MLLQHKTCDIFFGYNEFGSIFFDLSITNKYKELSAVYKFLLDTGATSTIINYETIEDLELDDNILRTNLSTILLADGSKRNASTIILKHLK